MLTKRLLSVAITLTVGVILGFSILILSERHSTSFYQNQLSRGTTLTTPAHSEQALMAELKAEVARLEALLARNGQDPHARVSMEATTGANAAHTLPPRSVALAPPTGSVPAERSSRQSRSQDPLHNKEPRTTRTALSRPCSRAETQFLPAPPGFDRNAVIEGTVVDHASGQAVKVFTVGIKRDHEEWVRKEIQQQQGQFRWTLAPGQTDLFVYAPGHAHWLRTKIDLLAGTVTRMTIHMEPDRRLEGHVVDAETGHPVAGAQLALSETDGGSLAWTTTTRTDGWFSARDPYAEGRTPRIKITHDDYATLLTELPTRLPSGRVEFRLRRGAAVLLGEARTADQKPLYGATIRIIKDDADQPEVKTASSDMEGRFRVSGLTPGRYLVWASARRFPGAVRVLHLTPGESRLASFVFRPGLSLGGRVIGGDASPTPLRIQAFDASGGFLMEVPVSRDGRFRLENLAPGSYTLHIQERDSIRPLKTFEIQVPADDGEITLNL